MHAADSLKNLLNVLGVAAAVGGHLQLAAKSHRACVVGFNDKADFGVQLCAGQFVVKGFSNVLDSGDRCAEP